MVEQKKKKRTVPTLDICEEKKLFKPFILGEKQHEFQIFFCCCRFSTCSFYVKVTTEINVEALSLFI